MKKLLCLLSLSLLIFSCVNEEISEQPLSSNQASTSQSGAKKSTALTAKSSSIQYSLFQVTQEFNSGTEAVIVGEIYCSQAVEAKFQFGYHGNVPTKYEVRMPGVPLITSAFGPSNRTITTQLLPGINTFSVTVKFSGPNQYANAKLSLLSINNDTSLNAEGDIDLTAQGYSEQKAVDGSSNSMHAICSKCGALNLKDALKCISCGK